MMKLIAKILGLFFLGLLLFVFIFIVYLKSDYNASFVPSEVNQTITDIKNAKPLPESFIKVYDQVNGFSTTNQIILHQFFSDYSKHCPCLELTYNQRHLFNYKERFTGNRYVLAWKFEKELSPDQCLNALAAYYDFTHDARDIYQAARFYFQRELGDLNWDEMATLSLMMRNSSLYNPRRRPELVKKTLEDIKATMP